MSERRNSRPSSARNTPVTMGSKFVNYGTSLGGNERILTCSTFEHLTKVRCHGDPHSARLPNLSNTTRLHLRGEGSPSLENVS